MMAKRRNSGNSFTWVVVGGMVLAGLLLYLRDRGLLHLPQPQSKPASQRAADLSKKYPGAEVFTGPETTPIPDKKKVNPRQP